MPTEVSHGTVKAQIETLLEANATLYDATGANDKIRQINVGYPDGEQGIGHVSPSIYITNSDSQFETIRPIGSIVSNAIVALEHTFHYNIVIVVDKKGSETAESKLDTYQNQILTTLEANPNLGGNVDISFPVSVSKLRIPGKPLGIGLRGRIIAYRCISTTGPAGEADETVAGRVSSISIAAATYPLKKLWNITKDHGLIRNASTIGPDFHFGRNNHSFSITIEATVPDLPTIDAWTDEDGDGNLPTEAIVVSLPPTGGGATATASFNTQFFHAEYGQPNEEGKVLIKLDGVVTSSTITWA